MGCELEKVSVSLEWDTNGSDGMMYEMILICVMRREK